MRAKKMKFYSLARRRCRCCAATDLIWMAGGGGMGFAVGEGRWARGGALVT